jgi:tripartite-type tricarboxylate transporter receptor subunit TctC
MLSTLIKTVGIAVLGSVLAGGAVAQTNFPTKPVKIIVPFTAGSQVDLVARELGRGLQDKWGQPVIVENRPGAGGTIGSRMVANAEPDGSTLMFTSASHAINPTLYNSLPYDTLKDFTGVTFGTSVPNVLVVSPSLGVKNVQELIKLINAQPGKLNFASAGVGSGTHFNGEMFKGMGKLDIVHVPYKGTGEALVDTTAGRAAFYWSPLGLTLPFIKDGKLIPLAVSTDKRAALMPDIPAISEIIPGMVYDHWYGLMAPSKTPAAVVAKISKDAGEVLTAPAVVKSLNAQGVIPAPTTPAQFNAFIAAEIKRLGDVVISANIPRQ